MKNVISVLFVLALGFACKVRLEESAVKADEALPSQVCTVSIYAAYSSSQSIQSTSKCLEKAHGIEETTSRKIFERVVSIALQEGFVLSGCISDTTGRNENIHTCAFYKKI